MTTLSDNIYAPTMLLDTAGRIQRQADHHWRRAGRAMANSRMRFHVMKTYPRMVQANVADEATRAAVALELEARMLEREAWDLHRERAR